MSIKTEDAGLKQLATKPKLQKKFAQRHSKYVLYINDRVQLVFSLALGCTFACFLSFL